MEPRSKIGLLLVQIEKNLNTLIRAEMEKNNLDDLSPSQGRVLFLLMKKDGVPIQSLCDKVSLTNSTMTVIIDALEEKKLVKRVPSKKDRRKILIELKPGYKKILKKYTKILNDITDKMYQGLDRDEIQNFEHTSQKILSNLEDKIS